MSVRLAEANSRDTAAATSVNASRCLLMISPFVSAQNAPPASYKRNKTNVNHARKRTKTKRRSNSGVGRRTRLQQLGRRVQRSTATTVGERFGNGGALLARVVQAEFGSPPEHVLRRECPLFAAQVVELGFEQPGRDLASKVGARTRRRQNQVDAAAVCARQSIRDPWRKPRVTLAQLGDKLREVTIRPHPPADPARKIAARQIRAPAPRRPGIAKHRDNRIA